MTAPEPRVIPTADVLRALPYHSPVKGWHSHGMHLIPDDGCAACAQLAAQGTAAGEPARVADAPCPPCRDRCCIGCWEGRTGPGEAGLRCPCTHTRVSRPPEARP